MDSLPEELFVEEPVESRRSSRAPDNWQPQFTLEAAIAKLGAEISDTLAEELKGSFREVRRYQPSASLEAEQREHSTANTADETFEDEIDSDSE